MTILISTLLIVTLLISKHSCASSPGIQLKFFIDVYLHEMSFIRKISYE
jgi:hypothetical protein